MIISEITISEFIRELECIDGSEYIESIGAYSGYDRTALYCIHTNKGDYDIGRKEINNGIQNSNS